jgi:hypothetical protein
MDKERYNQIIDETYKNYEKEYEKGSHLEGTGLLWMVKESKETFIYKCKTDNEFSERWGLKIEERELDMFERWKIADLTPNMMEFDYCNKLCDEHNVPTKLITVAYKDETIEIFE